MARDGRSAAAGSSAGEAAWSISYTLRRGQRMRIRIPVADLRRDVGVAIGREGRGNDVNINHPTLSGAHCRLLLDEHGNLTLQDRGSRNGTYVNGKRLAANATARVSSADLITLADLEISLEAPAAAAAPEAARPGAPPAADAPDRTVFHAGQVRHERSVIDDEDITASVGTGRRVESPSDSALRTLFTFGARRPLVSLALSIVLTGLAAWGFLNLQLDTSYDSMFSRNDPGYIPYKAVTKAFGSDNISLIYLKDDALFTPDRLADLEDLTYALADLGVVEKSESLFTALNIRDSDGLLVLNPLMDVAPSSDEEAAQIRENALYSPLMLGDIVSDDATRTAISVTAVESEGDPTYNRRLYEQYEALLAPLREKFDRVFQVGPPRLNVEIEQGMFRDLKLISPLAALILITTIVVFLRTPAAAFIPLTTAGLSIFWTLGFMGFAGIPFNLLTAILPALVIVIGSTEDTHMLVTYMDGMEESGKDAPRIDGVRYMASHVGLPIVLTSFTTAVGFLSNGVSDIALIRDFGFASSFAMVANLCSTVLMLPLMLRFFGPRPRKPEPARAPKSNAAFSLEPVLSALEDVSDRHQGKVVVATLAVVAVCSFGATQVKVSNDPLSYFKSDNPIIDDAQTLHEDLSGMQVFYLTIAAEQDKDFRDPDQLGRVERLVTAMRETGSFDKVLSIVDHLSLINREMNGRDPAKFHVPGDQALIEQYLLLFRRNDIERYLSSDSKRVNILIRHNISDSWKLNQVMQELDGRAREILGAGMEFVFSGKNLLINRAAETLFTSQIWGLALLIGIIFVTMSLLYSSLMAGVLSLLPNLIPIAVLFGVMGFFGVPLNPGTAIVAVIAVGIAIDDTIHLVTRYNAECRIDPDQNLATRNAIRAEALPVVSTSLSLAAGFSVLLFSKFNIVSQFGALSAMTMIVAMVTDLVVTPVLMRRLRLVGIWDVISIKLGREDVLIKSELFRGMSGWQIRKTILLSVVKEFDAGEVVIQQGDVGEDMYLVLTGTAEVLRIEGNQKVMLARLECGNVFGEAGYMGASRRSATVRASRAGPMQVLVLNAEKVASSMRFYPWIGLKLQRNINRIVVGRL